MTAFYESSDTQRARHSRDRSSRNGNGNGSRNGRSSGDRSRNGNGFRNVRETRDTRDTRDMRDGMVDARDLQEAVRDLKLELERSGRPDRFVIEKMELIEQFAANVMPLMEASGAGEDGFNAVPWTQLGRDIQQVKGWRMFWEELCEGIQDVLGTDRVAVYQFGADWSGEFVAEAVDPEWPPLLGNASPDGHLQERAGGSYGRGQSVVVPDIYDAGYQSCHVQFFERCRAKGYVAVPMMVSDRLWGLLMVFQNQDRRDWSPLEVRALEQLAMQAGVVIQRLQREERDRLMGDFRQLEQVADWDRLLGMTTAGLQNWLQCSRAAVYRFGADWSGEFVAEAIASGMTPVLNRAVADPHFQSLAGGAYGDGESLVVSDVNSSAMTSCLLSMLERAQVRSLMTVPIFEGDRLWGLLSVHQDEPRCWSAFELEMLETVGATLSQGVQRLVAEQRSKLSRLVQDMRQIPALDRLLEVTTQKMRQMLECDRLAVYQFNADWSGRFTAESVGRNWPKLVGNDSPDAYFNGLQGGRYREAEPEKNYRAMADITQGDLDEKHLALIEKTQAKAYLSVPIVGQGKVWGLLIGYQNRSTRQWSRWDIEAMREVATALGAIAQQVQSIEKLQQQVARQRSVAVIVDRIHQFLDLDTIMQTTNNELRLLMKVDRALVYRFNDDWSGDFVSEAVSEGWRPLLGRTIRDTYFERTQGGRYVNCESLVVADVFEEDYDPCHVELLKDFQCRAYIIVPVLANEKLWGLLAVYQNDRVRHWDPEEVDLVTQMGTQMGVAVQQANYLNTLKTQRDSIQASVERDEALSGVIDKMRRSFDLAAIFETTTNEMRRLLKGDRVAIYKFNEDWSGQFVAESVGARWRPLLELQERDRSLGSISDCNSTLEQLKTVQTLTVKDTYLMDNEGGRYREDQTMVVNDVTQAGFSECYLVILRKFQAKAYATVPVFQGDRLWGLLAVYQCDNPREWQESEVDFIAKVGAQLGIALNQTESLRALKRQNALIQKSVERDAAISSVIDKIRASLDIDTIFRTTTMEVRRLLESDRVGIYRFNEDWSGEFVAESVGHQWTKLIEAQKRNADMRPRIGEASDCETLERMRVQTLEVKDTYLMETQGGGYQDGQAMVVNDVNRAGFPECYLDVLRMFEARAYATVPIFRGDRLWGLLATYQCSGPREWEAVEVGFVSKVAAQLGLALDQTETLTALQRQNALIQKTVERQAAISDVIDKVRASLDIDTIFRTVTMEVRRLLEGDRVGIYRFNEDWSGEFIAESVEGRWTKLIDRQQTDPNMGTLIGESSDCSALKGMQVQTLEVRDTYLMDNQGGRYQTNQAMVVNDVNNAGFPECYLEVLRIFQARAYATVPIYKGEKLWGLLATYQCSGPREWESAEVDFVLQVAAQLGLALKQAESLSALQQQSEQLEQVAQRDKAAREDLQQKALNLLVAVRPALEGDLTVRAPITDDEMGTIADAYNNTLQSLRQIVVQLQDTASKVSDTSQNSAGSMTDLAGKSQDQYAALNAALTQVQDMAAATSAVTDSAQQVNAAVQQATATIATGDEAMDQTVDAILSIRDTVAETGRKIRALSDSSQKISKIVNLIGNFTTQTQLLALNAAIEATRAGEYGRGFTVVADEVRSLARQSAAATTEIEALVGEIQSETSAVAEAMETGIQQVAEGTSLVSSTRQSLSDVVAVTAQIGELVETITQASQTQTQQAESVTQTMGDVAAIADTASKESVALAKEFEELLAISEELQASVGRFKVQ